MKLEKYTMGVGDRFGRQGYAQLQAMRQAQAAGITVIPVWNKSFREHSIIGTVPADTRKAADQAVQSMGWSDAYYVDADHINLKTVDSFIPYSDFFTLDVADYIGQTPRPDSVQQFIEQNRKYVGSLQIPGVAEPIQVTESMLTGIANTFLFAVQEAGKIFQHIKSQKSVTDFVVEVSMDEAHKPQTPAELFFILAAIAAEGIPAQTIAPKFSGRFNKGVEYVGDVKQFSKEFEEDLCVIRFAIDEFGLPENLKLSVHSGSDKFSIYEPIGRAIRSHNAGLHLKTAGTTWLEELIGLAAAGGDGLQLAKEVYTIAYGRFDELCVPYAPVIDIDKSKLPKPEVVSSWNSAAYTDALRHDASCPGYNPHVRQLLHVGYKVAAEMGERYHKALLQFATPIGVNVQQNLYDRHIKRLFL
jgi:tagaturonate epimerase